MTVSVPADDRPMISTLSGLEALCEDLRSAGSFALDTEFLGERTYVPVLCLVQVATSTFTAIIDPIAVRDLSCLWTLVSDPGVEVILHAAREDLRLSYFKSNKSLPRNIFDTQVAAAIVGLQQYPLSYARLVEGVCAVKLGKTETRSEWDRRPLTKEQLDYARDDVRYLPALANKLKSAISNLERQNWMNEEMSRFSLESTYEIDPEKAYLRIRPPRQGLTRREAGYLKAYASWREEWGIATDRSPRFLLRDEAVLELSLRPPQRLGDFQRLRTLSNEQSDLFSDLIRIAQETRKLTDEDLPCAISGTTDSESAYVKVKSDLVYALACALCMECEVAPELLITRQSALDLVLGKIDATLMSGWRADLVGNTLFKLVSGSVSLCLTAEPERLGIVFQDVDGHS